ncbi:MAG: hypothetical protein HY423_01825 [Candidatus Lambdaproteobacteria bacterium]|nr:hypothetical protein [Candidatus Lambdaproteobacteria bacterium]
MATLLDPPIEVTFCGHKEPTVFRTLDDLRAWAQREKAFWADIENRTSSVPNSLKPGLWQQRDAFDAIIKMIGDDNAEVPDEKLAGARAKISRELVKFTDESRNVRLVLSQSRVAMHVRDRIESDASVALAMLAAFINLEIGLVPERKDSLLVLRGLVDARLFEREIGSAEASGQALDRLVSEHRAALNKQNADQLAQLKQAAEQKERGDAQIGVQEKRSLAELEAGKQRLDKLWQLYNQKLQLLAPVDYWTRKSKGHRWTAIAAGGIFIGLVSTIFILLYVYQSEIFELYKVKTEGSPWWLVVLVGVPVFLAIWTLRIVSRILLTNLKLYEEAKERRTMINTFLALMQEPKNVTEQDRILILGAIFRPSSGVGTDDAAPPHWFDLLLQRLGKKDL